VSKANFNESETLI